MLHRYQEAVTRRVPLAQIAAESTPGRELLFLLGGVTYWLGKSPCIQGSRQGQPIYVFYRDAAFSVGDFWESFGSAMAIVQDTWPVSVYGTAKNQETVRLTAQVQEKMVCLTQQSISGKPAEILNTLCFQIDCRDKNTADILVKILAAMNSYAGVAAIGWQYADFVREQRLFAAEGSRGFFCYVGLDPEATGSDCLLSLEFDQKIALWTAFLGDGLQPVEFEWLVKDIAEGALANRMEWELALHEAIDELGFRVVNQEKSFALFDSTGRRRYFGADCRHAPERALLKILFPLNY